jgi:hypothetical protein
MEAVENKVAVAESKLSIADKKIGMLAAGLLILEITFLALGL